MLGNTSGGLVYSPSTSRRLLISLTICLRLELPEYKKLADISVYYGPEAGESPEQNLA